MGSQMLGADLAEMDQLARACDSAASRLSALASSVRNGIRISAWAGPVAGRFRADWDSEHSRILRHAADELRLAAKHVRVQAEQQRVASAAVGPGSSQPTARSVSWSRLGAVDYGDFAIAGYGRSTPEGWYDVSGDELDHVTRGLPLHDSGTGFDARVLTDGHGHYVVTFGGTDPGVNLTDGLNPDEVDDIRGAAGRSEQGRQAMQLAAAVSTAAGASRVVFTGHSLGGRNAALAAVSTGGRAVTFDAAGVSDADLLAAELRRPERGPTRDEVVRLVAGTALLAQGPRFGVLRPITLFPQDRAMAKAHVTNYANVTSLVNVAQVFTPLPNALGVQVPLLDWTTLSPIKSHDVESSQRSLEFFGLRRQHG